MATQAAGAGGRSARAGVADAAGVPGRTPLTLDGLALNLQALTSVEAALTRVAGFAPAKAGGTQRDAEGRWQFSFTLTGARADAD